MKEEILKILAEAGHGGLRVRKIILHVYNSQNSLFEKADLDEVKKCVLTFLQQNSRNQHDILDHPAWGVYRLNPKSKQAKAIKMSFQNNKDIVSVSDQPKPKSSMELTLFDDFI